MSDEEPELDLDDAADDARAGAVATDEEETHDHLAWEGATVDAADAMVERALAYGMYVNLGRALPDVRDGLKPVQRRILYSMDELGARAGRKYVKSARVVGHVIGNYHPHGDSAAYDAMVRMAQDFSMGQILVDGQGNFGSVGPKEFSDPAAHYRYTEARLSPAATDWLADLRPEIVEHRTNFTEERDEPWVLPVTFPNLLVNGSKGIGWSMACEIPPHNLAETCRAAIALAENPDATLADLLAAMPGPDFPTGGIVVDPDGLADAYERGQGTLRLQAKFHIEQLPGNVQAIVVTELPYGVSPDQVVAEVVKAARAGKIEDVTEMPRNLSDRGGLRVQVRCKRGGNVTRLIADLMRQTSLRVSVGINMTVLVDGAPRQIGLRAALDHFVTFRFDVVTKRLEHERATLMRDLHRLVALLAALAEIDEVIRIVRESEDDDHAREQLKLKLTVKLHGARSAVPIDDQQAQWILDMPIKRLARLNRLALEKERRAKGERVDEIGRILDDYDALRAIVVSELEEAIDRYGVPRRTVLGGEARADQAQRTDGSSAPTRRDLAVVAGPKTGVLLFATANGACATRPQDGRLQRVPVNLTAGDAPVAIVTTDTEAELQAFSSDGMVYRLRVADIPIESRVTRGVRAIALARGATLAGICAVEPPGGFLLLVTERGEIKRCEAQTFASSHLGGAPAFDVPDGDRVICVLPHAAGDEILLHTARGQALRFAIDKVRPVKSAGAGGVAGIALRGDDRVVAATRADGAAVLVLHENGHGKLVPLADYPTKGRATGGVVSANPGAPKREPAGAVVTAATVGAGEILVATAAGGLARLDPAAIEPAARSTVSRRLVDVAVGDEPAVIHAP